MKRDKQTRFEIICVYLRLSAVPLLLAGCGGKPNPVNIELRKQVQSLEAQQEELNRQHAADAATIRSLEQRSGTIATLPRERLSQLFTTHGIKIGRLSGGIDTDSNRPGDESLKVYVVPIDQHGDPIKAAGKFTVEAFDLSISDQNRIAQRDFPLDQVEKNWYGDLMSYTYAFSIEWKRPPQGIEIIARVTFEDSLTGRVFTEQKAVKVNPPKATATRN